MRCNLILILILQCDSSDYCYQHPQKTCRTQNSSHHADHTLVIHQQYEHTTLYQGPEMLMLKCNR